MGDECLRKTGGVLLECLRGFVDLAARYGGEEFACILSDMDLAAAVETAQRIKGRIQDLKRPNEKSPVTPMLPLASVSPR